MIVCMDVSLVHINMMYTCVGASRQKAEEMARQLAVKTRECEVLCMYVCMYVYIHILTSVNPSIVIDGVKWNWSQRRSDLERSVS